MFFLNIRYTVLAPLMARNAVITNLTIYFFFYIDFLPLCQCGAKGPIKFGMWETGKGLNFFHLLSNTMYWIFTRIKYLFHIGDISRDIKGDYLLFSISYLLFLYDLTVTSTCLEMNNIK